MPPLLSIKDLDVSFRQGNAVTNAVTEINFDINSGEIVAVVGESGSGKSVTALSVLGLMPASAISKGQIILTDPHTGAGTELLSADADTLREIRGNRISMIFQEPMTALNPVLTCGHQVIEAILAHHNIGKPAARKQAIALFEKVQLPDPAGMLIRYPHQLSGGQKQRVMIAMAMCNEPALLIADEPTTALDVTVQRSILDLIRQLQQQQQMSVLLISHDLGLVADIADRIVVMYKGRIVEQGPAKQVLTTPTHDYTKALLACRPAGKAKGSRLPVVSDFIGEGRKEGAVTTPITREASSETLIEVKDLMVSFSRSRSFFGKPVTAYHAVDGVSFSIRKGETLGLVGESGCGKTTLGRALLKLVPISSGRILLEGTDIAHIRSSKFREMRKDLQIVFQDPFGSLNPRITVGNAILEPLNVHGIHSPSQRKEKVIELLEKVKLDAGHFSRYPHQFSGGQRQRICIARALALNPSFLVFDESVSALDVSVQAQVLNLLNELKAEFGYTSLFISHDLSVVRYISDRIMVMKQGRIIETGDAETVYNNPVNEYTKQLLEAVPGKALI